MWDIRLALFFPKENNYLEITIICQWILLQMFSFIEVPQVDLTI